MQQGMGHASRRTSDEVTPGSTSASPVAKPRIARCCLGKLTRQRLPQEVKAPHNEMGQGGASRPYIVNLWP